MLFGGSRILSAVEPLLCSVFAIGAVTLLQKVRILPIMDTRGFPDTRNGGSTLASFSFGMSFIVIAAPFFIHAISIRPDFITSPQVHDIRSPEGFSPVIFHASKGSSLHIVSDTTPSGLPDVKLRDFKGWVPYAPFSGIREGSYVINLFNLLSPNEYAYLVLDVNPEKFSGRYCLLTAQRYADSHCTVYYGNHLEVIR
jgi:hypothetical protein